MEFLVGERLEHLKRSHLALEADDLIPAEVMLNIYGKEREHQVGHSGVLVEARPMVASFPPVCPLPWSPQAVTLTRPLRRMTHAVQDI